MSKLVDLDNYSKYKTDGLGNVYKVKGGSFLSVNKSKGTVSLGYNNSTRNISIAKLTYHQHIEKVSKDDLIIIDTHIKGSYLDQLVCVDKSANSVRTIKLTPEEREEICQEYQTGFTSISDLSEGYEVSMTSIRNTLKGKIKGCSGSKLYLEDNPTGSKRGDWLKRKANRISVELKRRKKEGYTTDNISTMYQMPASTVKKYLKRKNVNKA